MNPAGQHSPQHSTYKLCNKSLVANSFPGLDELPADYLAERQRVLERIKNGEGGPGIVHLGGSSKFAGGHFFDIMDRHFRALPQDVANWGICAVTRNPLDANGLQQQDGMFVLASMEPLSAADQGVRKPDKKIVGSVVEALCLQDTDLVLRRMCDPHVKLVTVTVTTKGLLLLGNKSLNAKDPGLARDLAPPENPDLRTQHPDWKLPPSPLSTYLSLITTAIQIRRELGIPPFSILSLDNTQPELNGQLLRTAVAELAQRYNPPPTLHGDARVLRFHVESEIRTAREAVWGALKEGRLNVINNGAQVNTRALTLSDFLKWPTEPVVQMFVHLGNTREPTFITSFRPHQNLPEGFEDGFKSLWCGRKLTQGEDVGGYVIPDNQLHTAAQTLTRQPLSNFVALHVPFLSSMVDRIVPWRDDPSRPDHQHSPHGHYLTTPFLEHRGGIVTAERYYCQLAVEGTQNPFPLIHITTPESTRVMTDVRGISTIKYALVNSTHVVVGWLGAYRGTDNVNEIVRDVEVVGAPFLTNLIDRETKPWLRTQSDVASADLDVIPWRTSDVIARLSNPHCADPFWRLNNYPLTKIPNRILNIVYALVDQHEQHSPPPTLPFKLLVAPAIWSLTATGKTFEAHDLPSLWAQRFGLKDKDFNASRSGKSQTLYAEFLTPEGDAFYTPEHRKYGDFDTAEIYRNLYAWRTEIAQRNQDTTPVVYTSADALKLREKTGPMFDPKASHAMIFDSALAHALTEVQRLQARDIAFACDN